MGVTVGDAVDRCYRTWLYGTYERDRNVLAEPLGIGDDTIKLKYQRVGPSEGGLIAVDRELCSIMDVSDGGRTLNVLRGVDGTHSAAYGIGRQVEINPRYARGTVTEDMWWELQSWSEEAVRVQAVRVDVAAYQTAFELVGIDTRTRRVLDVQRPARSSAWNLGSPFADQRWFPVRFRPSYDVFTDGDVWINLDTSMCAASTYRVIVGTDWPVTLDQWTSDLDLQEDVGMTPGLIDALVLGATWRVITAKEGRRLQLEAEGQTRDAQEVPAGQWRALGTLLLTLRQQRLDEEMQRFIDRYGFGGYS